MEENQPEKSDLHDEEELHLEEEPHGDETHSDYHDEHQDPLTENAVEEDIVAENQNQYASSTGMKTATTTNNSDNEEYEYEDDFIEEEEQQHEIHHIKEYKSRSNSDHSDYHFSDAGSDDGDHVEAILQSSDPDDVHLDGWEALAFAQQDMLDDGWDIRYDADIDEAEQSDAEEEEIDEKEIEFLFERRRSPIEGELPDLNLQIEPGASDFILKYLSTPAISSSEQKFIEEYMKVPETPAQETLSKEAAQDTQADYKKLYYPSHPSYVPGEEYASTASPVLDRCPSIESYFRQKKVVDVQFFLYPGSKMISKECRLDTTVFQLKMAIGRYVKIPPTHLDMRRHKNLIQDDKTLLDLGARPNKKMKFTLEINKRIPGSYEIKLPRDRVLVPIPDTVIRVKIETDDGTIYFINVKIEYPKDLKLMIGGFIDQRTKKKFHHATTSMETHEKPLKKNQQNISTQCWSTKVSTVQTLFDKGQQMEKKGLYLPNEKDRVMEPKPYLSHAYWEGRRATAALYIQRFWRRWLAIRERKRREAGLINRVKWAENIRKGRLEQRKAIMDEETSRQEHPKRIVDLELLYRAINEWRQGEEEYVNHNRWGPERKAALATLAELESDLLLDLERTKNRINVEERENRNQRCFDKMGKPKRWLSAKTPNFITVDDGEKVFVRQLQFIYTQLQEQVPNTPKGLEYRCILLGQLNFMTKNMKSKMSDMLTQLVARELNFLRNPKASQSLLIGIRRRIANTFFFLCQDPKFNPEAKKVQKVPWDPEKLRKDMIQCKGCRRMQYRDEFTIVKGTTVTSRCHTCMNLYRTAILRVDLNLFRHMLKELRRDELQAGVVNSVTFLMDAFDLQFLVDQIWHGQSALSGIDNRYLLRLCRWKKAKPWAPWNCVLLTEEEATAHLQLEHMPNAYKESFFHKVLVKQCTAKTYFEGIAKLTVGLDARVEETCKAAGQREKRANFVRKKIMDKAKMLGKLGNTLRNV